MPSGLAALDALVKEADVSVRFAGDIDPGRFLILLEGDLASVEVALQRVDEVGAADLLETLLLPRAHGALRAALVGQLASTARPRSEEHAIGAIATYTVISTLAAVDRALKAADVCLLRLRLSTDLAGQGHAVIAGEQFDVEAALEAANQGAGAGVAVETRLIPRAASLTFDAAAQRPYARRQIRPLES